jgi:hypothetical protein
VGLDPPSGGSTGTANTTCRWRAAGRGAWADQKEGRWTTRTRLELDRWTITLYYERCSLLLLQLLGVATSAVHACIRPAGGFHRTGEGNGNRISIPKSRCNSSVQVEEKASGYHARKGLSVAGLPWRTPAARAKIDTSRLCAPAAAAFLSWSYAESSVAGDTLPLSKEACADPGFTTRMSH